MEDLERLKYNRKYKREHKEELKEKRKQYDKEHEEEHRQRGKEYYKNNREACLESVKNWQIKNPDYMKQYRKEHEKEIKQNGKRYYKENKEKIKEKHESLSEEEYNDLLIRQKEWNQNQKLLAFQKISKQNIPSCKFCEEQNLDFLTIDHIKNDGHKWRKTRKMQGYNFINNNKISAEELSSLQILCYNCNCGKTRKYFNLTDEERTSQQKHAIKWWNKAYKFFGKSCKTCGDTELIHLTISHIHNDGAKRRKNGERTGVGLIKTFEKLGWPESLKEDYCLECYNCNCSRKFNSN